MNASYEGKFERKKQTQYWFSYFQTSLKY